MADQALPMRYQALAARFGGLDNLVESLLRAVNHHGDREMSHANGWDFALSLATEPSQAWSPPRDAVLTSVLVTLKVAGTTDTVISVLKNAVAIATVTVLADETRAVAYFDYDEPLIFLADTDDLTNEITTAGTDASGLGVVNRLKDVYVYPG